MPHRDCGIPGRTASFIIPKIAVRRLRNPLHGVSRGKGKGKGKGKKKGMGKGNEKGMGSVSWERGPACRQAGILPAKTGSQRVTFRPSRSHAGFRAGVDGHDPTNGARFSPYFQGAGFAPAGDSSLAFGLLGRTGGRRVASVRPALHEITMDVMRFTGRSAPNLRAPRNPRRFFVPARPYRIASLEQRE
ncbi:MAG: hypothetical protein D6679_07495 [Candidatus Hydrogenedentota bacterium]|nr:MAG: hypothetical protein D6679_07495 [Candidatus Hydrogenedentota bacterium]